MYDVKDTLSVNRNDVETLSDDGQMGVRCVKEQQDRIVKMILVALFYVSIAIYLLTNNAVVGVIMILIWALLVLLGQGFMTLPTLSIFCNILQIPLIGEGFFKYAILILMIFDIIREQKIGLTRTVSIQLMVCFLFTAFVLFPIKGLAVLVYLPIMFYIGYIWMGLRKDESRLKRFCRSFVITMLISLLVGAIQQNVVTETSIIGDNAMELGRFFATFNDPNYAGLFINAAVFMCVIFNPFPKYINLAALIALYFGLVATSSMTAIVCNLVIMVFLFVQKYGFRFKTALIILGFAAMLTLVYIYGLNSNFEFLNMMSTRIKLKFEALIFDNDVSAFTSGRTGLVEQHWNFLKNEGPWFNWLFGGISSNALYCTPRLGAKVAHLEYLDLLLNIGLIGMILYLGSMLARFVQAIRSYYNKKTDSNKLYIALYINYFVCGLSLTLFMEPQFFIWVMM